MQRTIRIKLLTTPEQDAALLETAGQFTNAFNEVCRVGWEGSEKNGVKLHHLTYRPLKAEYPDLVSDLHIQARVKATEAVKSALTRKRKGLKTTCPRSALCPPRYNLHTFKMDWAAGMVRLSTTRGRLGLGFTLPPYFAPMVGATVCTADLIRRQGGWWLHVAVDVPIPEVAPSDHTLGVDLGICHPAVTSDGDFLGEQRWREIEARIFRRKRQCQAKGTQSARRRLRILRGRQARFRRDCDHVLSRRIVDATEPGGTIVLENLTDIRSRAKQKKGKHNRRFHGWTFAQLKGFIAYKAEDKGCQVELIDPRHTSQTCSQCGFKHRSNRRSQSEFACRSCGYRVNADLNGARNVRAKHLGIFGMPVDVRPPSTGPTVLTDQCGRV
jgi:putative transposase